MYACMHASMYVVYVITYGSTCMYFYVTNLESDDQSLVVRSTGASQARLRGKSSPCSLQARPEQFGLLHLDAVAWPIQVPAHPKGSNAVPYLG